MRKQLTHLARVTIKIFVLITLLSGCMTQTIQRGVSSNLVSYLYSKGEMVFHENDSTPVFNLPLRVGIAFIPESQHDYTFTLTEVEKQTLLQQVADKFKADKAVSHIQIIPEIYLKQGKGFITVSQVASLYDVDIVALASYDQVAINELNNWSMSYWTIVGAFVVPGETTEFQTFVDTAVFDGEVVKVKYRKNYTDGGGGGVGWFGMIGLFLLLRFTRTKK
jgi:rhombotail lipoprotein